MTAPKWAPFAEPSPGQVASLISDQLTNLIKEMQGGTPSAQAYLLAFWDMINQAIETMPFPPSQVRQFFLAALQILTNMLVFWIRKRHCW